MKTVRQAICGPVVWAVREFVTEPGAIAGYTKVFNVYGTWFAQSSFLDADIFAVWDVTAIATFRDAKLVDGDTRLRSDT